jgi:hypothetical protein
VAAASRALAPALAALPGCPDPAPSPTEIGRTGPSEPTHMARPASGLAADAAVLDPLLRELPRTEIGVRPPGGDLHQAGLEDLQTVEVRQHLVLLTHPSPAPVGGVLHEVGHELAGLGVL